MIVISYAKLLINASMFRKSRITVETGETIETLGETCGNTMGNGRRWLGNSGNITSRESPY